MSAQSSKSLPYESQVLNSWIQVQGTWSDSYSYYIYAIELGQVIHPPIAVDILQSELTHSYNWLYFNIKSS